MARFEFNRTEAPESIQSMDWNSWTWQLRNSLKSKSDFARFFSLSESELKAFAEGAELFNIRTTPYYAGLCRPQEHDPLRRILMPKSEELFQGAQQLLDPLGEKRNNPVPRVIHRYSDRVLFLITDICSVYCRFCTRKHFTGKDQAFMRPEELSSAIKYIGSKPGIREVILSGGDPLTVGNEQLERVLFELRKIQHVEIIRIGSRMPVVCPQRIDESLVTLLRRYKPVYMMTHFNHPRELTAESAQALENFVDHGIPVFNQMVLLNGVNNHPAIIQALSRRLLYLRTKPYYMFQCDPSVGTDHLRTTVDQSMDIQRELWGHLSGLAMPTLSLDIPDGGGKAALVPQFEIARAENSRKYIGWDGVEAEYISPPAEQLMVPLDAESYMAEWEEIKNSKKH